ncbi:MAG: hypothetical protein ACOCP8_03890 [archaeon]
MNNFNEKEKTENAETLEEKGFTDKVDVNPSISLYKYEILRNPDTGETIICHEKPNGNIKATITNISKDNVLDALDYIGDGFYSFIGSSKEEELKRIEKNPKNLTHIINSLNMYSGTFEPSNFRMDLKDLKDYAKRK